MPDLFTTRLISLLYCYSFLAIHNLEITPVLSLANKKRKPHPKPSDNTIKKVHPSLATTTATNILPQEILYRRNIFSKEELETIQNDITTTYLKKLQPETTSSVANGRRGVALPSSAPTVQVFQQGSLLDWIIRVTGHSSIRLRHHDVPVEVRSYDKAGAGMAWHSDDVLFSPVPQLEVVWTLENNSDCQTLYKINDNHVENVQTEVNSVLLVPAGGPEHCVTSLQRGKRVIVKAVYALEESNYVQDSRVQQFQGGSKKKKGRRR